MAEQSNPTTQYVHDDRGGRWQRWSVLLPALTFLAGLLLGAAVIAATGSDDEPERVAAAGTSPAAPGPTPTATPLTVTVPGQCVEAAERAEVAYQILESGVAAARELNPQGVADAVARAQQERAQVEALIQQCRQAATDAAVNPAPTP